MQHSYSGLCETVGFMITNVESDFDFALQNQVEPEIKPLGASNHFKKMIQINRTDLLFRVHQIH